MTATNQQRRVRSFVLREGRLTAGQEKALEKYWHKYGINFSKKTVDLDKMFDRAAPKILDIGAGMGDSTLQLARAHPENDYLAVEVHKPGVGSLIRRAVEENLTNIRVISHDVMDVLRYQLPLQSLDEVYIFFPDPWPKKRHHKRRLINPPFLKLLLSTLKDNSQLFIATDWVELAEHIRNICDNSADLINLAGKNNTTPRPTWRPLTKFERRGQALSHPVMDFSYAKAAL